MNEFLVPPLRSSLVRQLSTSFDANSNCCVYPSAFNNQLNNNNNETRVINKFIISHFVTQKLIIVII